MLLRNVLWRSQNKTKLTVLIYISFDCVESIRTFAKELNKLCKLLDELLFSEPSKNLSKTISWDSKQIGGNLSRSTGDLVVSLLVNKKLAILKVVNVSRINPCSWLLCPEKPWGTQPKTSPCQFPERKDSLCEWWVTWDRISHWNSCCTRRGECGDCRSSLLDLKVKHSYLFSDSEDN
jgi:hypothetical protein